MSNQDCPSGVVCMNGECLPIEATESYKFEMIDLGAIELKPPDKSWDQYYQMSRYGEKIPSDSNTYDNLVRVNWKPREEFNIKIDKDTQLYQLYERKD